MAERRKATIHLEHCSLLAGMNNPEGEFKDIFDKGAHVVSFTELYGGNAGPMQARARKDGYQPVVFANAIGEGFAINTAKGVRLKNKGSVMVHPAAGGLPKRTINWIKVQYEGEDIFCHVGHWLAHLADGRARVERHNEMTQQMVSLVRKHGKDDDIAFFSGDINEDDKRSEDDLLGNMNSVFPRNGLLTIWDEFRVYPPTFKSRTIDIIGSYDKDGRVKGERYKVWPATPGGSDHRYVSAWYEIDLGKKKKKDKNKPTEGDTSGNPAEDDHYTHGKLVSFKDYRDQSIYNLPQAVDDSDGPNHGDTVD